MNEFETTLHIMMLNHISYDELAKRLGHSNPGNLYNSLNKNKNIYVGSLRKILDALGYEIVFREKGNANGGYVVSDDEESSPMRFHGMNLNIDAILGDVPLEPKKPPVMNKGQATLAMQALRQRTNELTFSECDKELRRIWNIKDQIEGKRKPVNEMMDEYLRYRKEFEEIYGNESYSYSPVVLPNPNPRKKRKGKSKSQAVSAPVIPSVPGGGHGNVITEDSEFEVLDMSEAARKERAWLEKKGQSDVLSSLVAGFNMED